MKRCLLRCLKAGLIGLWFLSAPSWAANDVSAGVNKADIEFTSVINGDNHMDVVISSGNGTVQGCTPGQYWDIGRGGCTSAIQLRTVSTSRACNCACPGAGSCTSSQIGTYPVLGWRLPPSGAELVSSNGATSWNACQIVTNSCTADTGPAHPPGSVEQIVVANLICDSSSPYYSMGTGTTPQKETIIRAYRQHVNGFGRCPEFMYAGYDGWMYWQNLVTSHQKTIDEVDREIRVEGVSNADVEAVVNAACADGARSAFGVGSFVSAKYIKGTGNRCSVTF